MRPYDICCTQNYINVSHVHNVSLLLTLNRFHTLLWCFHYSLLTIKCRLWSFYCRIQKRLENYTWFKVSWNLKTANNQILLIQSINRNTRKRCEICSKLTIFLLLYIIDFKRFVPVQPFFNPWKHQKIVMVHWEQMG